MKVTVTVNEDQFTDRDEALDVLSAMMTGGVTVESKDAGYVVTGRIVYAGDDQEAITPRDEGRSVMPSD